MENEPKKEQERLFPKRLMRVYKDMATPTNEWVELPPTLPEICLDLRSSINGSADPWSSSLLEEVVAMLKSRIKSWDFSYFTTMDSTIWSMVNIAIDLGEKELSLRIKDKWRW